MGTGQCSLRGKVKKRTFIRFHNQDQSMKTLIVMGKFVVCSIAAVCANLNYLMVMIMKKRLAWSLLKMFRHVLLIIIAIVSVRMMKQARNRLTATKLFGYPEVTILFCLFHLIISAVFHVGILNKVPF